MRSRLEKCLYRFGVADGEHDFTDETVTLRLQTRLVGGMLTPNEYGLLRFLQYFHILSPSRQEGLESLPSTMA